MTIGDLNINLQKLNLDIAKKSIELSALSVLDENFDKVNKEITYLRFLIYEKVKEYSQKCTEELK